MTMTTKLSAAVVFMRQVKTYKLSNMAKSKIAESKEETKRKT